MTPLKISCDNFTREEVDALKSLIGLLKPYLKRPFTVVGDAAADVRFVNLDAGRTTTSFDAASPMNIVRCAARPRMHGAGTLHLPWRVSEVLAVLSEASSEADAGRLGDSASAQMGVEWSFRLRAWPLNFERLPKACWSVLATMLRKPLTVAQIAARTGLEAMEVGGYLELIAADGALDRFAAPRTPAPAVRSEGSRWRSLAGRIGRALGFS